ncbi:MAG TPA: hypothetical protein VFG99_05630, partial [Chloroflexia bacterium]|nr:hypothetical protein [Chloroflexia bacterium]
SIAKWSTVDSSWSPLNSIGLSKPQSGQFSSSVSALAANGSNVYVGGSFTAAGEVKASNIARWNGTNSWYPLGSGMNGTVNAIAVSGNNAYVGGAFTTAGGVSANNIARWDGSKWYPLGSGVNGNAFAIAVSGADVYVVGSFTKAGGVNANKIGRWNTNSNTWYALGGGVTDAVYDGVSAIAVGGANGADVYVGVITAYSRFLRKWNGSSWSVLGAFWPGGVNAIAVSGNDVYVGGDFTRIISQGGFDANRLARWNTSSKKWFALGSGVNNTVKAIYVSWSHVYVGGDFTTAGGVSANKIAITTRDGSAWSTFGSGTNNTVLAIASLGNNRVDVYVGGRFSTAGGKPSTSFGVWHTPPPKDK